MANSDSSIVFATHPANKRFIDITGHAYGRLTVLGYAGTKNHGSYWYCRCECGTTKSIAKNSLLNKRSRSCGCLLKETITTHGQWHSPEYYAFHQAKQRCTNTKNEQYNRYGNRGIEFRFDSFEVFLACVGLRPTEMHSIDRIDNNGHYEIGNVRWATLKEQANNKRNTIRVEHNGTIVGLATVLNSRSGEYVRVLQLINDGLSPTEALSRILSKR